MEKAEPPSAIKKTKTKYEFVKKMNEKEKQFYQTIFEELKKEVGSVLTEIEIHNLSVISLWLDKYDTYENSVGIDKVNPELLNQARMYRNLFLERMKEARKNVPTTTNIVDDAKKILLELESGGKGKLEIEWENKEVEKRNDILDIVRLEKSRRERNSDNEKEEVLLEQV